MRVAVLHLICGLPGSGKSTLARALEREIDAVRLSPDEWFLQLGMDFHDEEQRTKIEALQWQLAQRLLTLGNDVILENGFWARSERDQYRREAGALGAKTVIHFLDAPLDELKQRIRRRNLASVAGTPQVDPASLDQWVRLFEPPTNDELA